MLLSASFSINNEMLVAFQLCLVTVRLIGFKHGDIIELNAAGWIMNNC